jgi:Kef-type K+ transport system membrane component KefB
LVTDFGTVILLALFFSRASAGVSAQLLLVGGLVLLAVAVVMTLRRAGHWSRLQMVLQRDDRQRAEIRVRLALLLLVAFAVRAERLGLEVILGAFLAGGVLALADRPGGATYRMFRQKPDAVGYGVFIPIFLFPSGLQVDLGALVADSASLALSPLPLDRV